MSSSVSQGRLVCQQCLSRLVCQQCLSRFPMHGTARTSEEVFHKPSLPRADRFSTIVCLVSMWCIARTSQEVFHEPSLPRADRFSTSVCLVFLCVVRASGEFFRQTSLPRADWFSTSVSPFHVHSSHTKKIELPCALKGNSGETYERKVERIIMGFSSAYIPFGIELNWAKHARLQVPTVSTFQYEALQPVDGIEIHTGYRLTQRNGNRLIEMMTMVSPDGNTIKRCIYFERPAAGEWNHCVWHKDTAAVGANLAIYLAYSERTKWCHSPAQKLQH